MLKNKMNLGEISAAMKVQSTLLFLSLLWSSTMAQLPLFLQRFRQHGLLSSGSTSYPSFGTPSLGHSFFSSPFSGSASSLSSHLGSPLFSVPSTFGSLSNHKSASASNLAHSLVDLGTVGHFEGLGGFDQAELVDDYPGFSNVGFAKDLNFAGSQAFKFQTSPPDQLVYVQR